jgi:hypothetical protein
VIGLGDREAGPEPYRPDFGSYGNYTAAWYYWRAVRRDARLTGAEMDARLAVRVERVEQWREQWRARERHAVT